MVRKRKRTAKGRAAEPKSAVTLVAMPSSWDLGAAGPANRAGLELEPRGDIDPETGKTVNPNGVQGARRIDLIEVWHRCFMAGCTVAGKPSSAWITTGQFNTAVLIRNTFEATQQAPGTDYAKPKVDSSPKPDHAVTIQIDRITAWHQVSRRIHSDDMPLLLHVVVEGKSIVTFTHKGRRPYAGEGFDMGMMALRMALERANPH